MGPKNKSFIMSFYPLCRIIEAALILNAQADCGHTGISLLHSHHDDTKSIGTSATIRPWNTDRSTSPPAHDMLRYVNEVAIGLRGLSHAPHPASSSPNDQLVHSLGLTICHD